MKEYKSVKQNFSDCPFSIMLPKVTNLDPFTDIEFSVGFFGKPNSIKYLIYKCELIDKLGNRVYINPKGQSNFLGKTKVKITLETDKLLKNAFEIIIRVFTINGEAIDVTYFYEKNKLIILKSVAICDMNVDEKKYFVEKFNLIIEAAKMTGDITLPQKKNNTFEKSNNNLEEYVEAISKELFFLKNSGGKKHKVTDGHLLTPNSNEFCYSFELENELYLADDAPVSLIKGIEKFEGKVIVCDGFQIIIALNSNIGEVVSSAQISVEPWKLLEKLREKIKNVTESDRIACKLFKDGPGLAEKISNSSSIKCGQDVAVSHALDNDITVIWGPPGTGKTYTMAQITKQFVLKGKSVLIVSHSNISVDNVVKQIANQFSNNGLSDIIRQGKVLRYG